MTERPRRSNALANWENEGGRVDTRPRHRERVAGPSVPASPPSADQVHLDGGRSESTEKQVRPAVTPTPLAAVPSPPTPATPPFRWSWKLVTIVGIDVYLHGTFLLLIAFLAFGDLVAGQGVTAMARGTLLLLAVFTSVVLHEFGHALMARRFGVRTRDITLLPIGGVARLEKMPEQPGQQLLVALAGPAVNVAIAALLFGLVHLLDVSVGLAGVAAGGGPFLTQLMWINVLLVVFNLLPGYPMDGGRVLRALLAMHMAPESATQTAARVGQVVAVVFALVGLFGNPFLIVIGVFVWLGAQAEHSASTTKIALSGLPVRQGMITDFDVVAPTDSLARAVELTLAGFQQDFPVMEDARLLGILTYSDTLKSLAEHGPGLAVQRAMRTELPTASPSESLSGALARMHAGNHRVLLVVENETLVGLLTASNIGELMALEKASQQSGASGASREGVEGPVITMVP